MLKFQDNYNIQIENMEDFILISYVMIDELYQQYAPKEIKERKNISKVKLSDSEIITISICGELMGIDSENAWYNFVKKNYLYLFPNLCCRSKFNRKRRNLLQVTELIREKLFQFFNATTDDCYIVDSFPLEVCKFGRAHFCRSFRNDGANYGKCPSKKATYFGFKVHALITLDGFITAFDITPASTDDREGLRDLMGEHYSLSVIGDKGYVGKQIHEDMAKQNICLLALKRNNSKKQWSKPFRQMIFNFLRRIETVFSQLSEQLNAERVLAKTFRGVCTRLVNKILAYDLVLLINKLFYPQQSVTCIKHLIF